MSVRVTRRKCVVAQCAWTWVPRSTSHCLTERRSLGWGISGDLNCAIYSTRLMDHKEEPYIDLKETLANREYIIHKLDLIAVQYIQHTTCLSGNDEAHSTSSTGSHTLNCFNPGSLPCI